MAPSDKIELNRLNYDSEKSYTQFGFTGWRDGQPFNVSGGLPVATPGDQAESHVVNASKAALKRLLLDLANTL
jgi:hypothetical protein